MENTEPMKPSKINGCTLRFATDEEAELCYKHLYDIYYRDVTRPPSLEHLGMESYEEHREGHLEQIIIQEMGNKKFAIVFNVPYLYSHKETKHNHISLAVNVLDLSLPIITCVYDENSPEGQGGFYHCIATVGKTFKQ